MPPTVEPMVRATSFNRFSAAGAAEAAGAALGLTARLRDEGFFAAGRFTTRFFLAVGSAVVLFRHSSPPLVAAQYTSLESRDPSPEQSNLATRVSGLGL